MKLLQLSVNRNRAQGFSLIEIIVVVTIIMGIVAFAVNQIFGKADQAQAKLGKAKMVSLSGPLDIYKLDTGKYPTTQEGLKALIAVPSGVPNWNGPYVKNADELKDPWRNDFIYRSPGAENRAYEIVSLGADGQEGGDGANRDLKSWD
ncbi:MAG: type II secretion system major pseudopilin GspG [Burkholderiales bacterium]|nr:type II secretion system major pseudopilin GspG [Burkholderiales bacterium]